MRKITIIILLVFLVIVTALVFYFKKDANNIEHEIYTIENEELIIDSQINELEKLDFNLDEEVSNIDSIQKEEANIDLQINELETLSF